MPGPPSLAESTDGFPRNLRIVSPARLRASPRAETSGVGCAAHSSAHLGRRLRRVARLRRLRQSRRQLAMLVPSQVSPAVSCSVAPFRLPATTHR